MEHLATTSYSVDDLDNIQSYAVKAGGWFNL